MRWNFNEWSFNFHLFEELDFFYNQVINDDIYRDYLLSLNANEERIVSKPWDPSHDVFDPVWDYKPELCFNREDGLSICESGYEY